MLTRRTAFIGLALALGTAVTAHGQRSVGRAPAITTVPVYYYPVPVKASNSPAAPAAYSIGGGEPWIMVFVPDVTGPASTEPGLATGAMGHPGSFSAPGFRAESSFGVQGQQLGLNGGKLLGGQMLVKSVAIPRNVVPARSFVVTRSWSTRSLFRNSSIVGGSARGSGMSFRRFSLPSIF